MGLAWAITPGGHRQGLARCKSGPGALVLKAPGRVWEWLRGRLWSQTTWAFAAWLSATSDYEPERVLMPPSASVSPTVTKGG